MKSEVKRFLIKLTIFSLPILLVLFFIEFKLSRIPNSYNYQRRNLEQQFKDIKVLVLGNSESFDGINPTFFSCTGFNLSNSSQDLDHDIKLTQKYLTRLPNLRSVFITVSYFSLGYKSTNSEESWRNYFYYRFWGIKSSDVNPLDPKAFSYIALYTPEKTKDYIQKRFNVNLVDNIAPNGWHDNTTEKSDILDDFHGQQRVDIHYKLMTPKDWQQNIKELDMFVKQLSTRNVRPVFITPPVYITYSNHVDPKVLESIHNEIKNICEKYPCKYYNYFNDQRFSLEDFKDNNHLNAGGAEKFSKILNEEVVSKVCQNE